jgi:hypothetical protein
MFERMTPEEVENELRRIATEEPPDAVELAAKGGAQDPGEVPPVVGRGGTGGGLHVEVLDVERGRAALDQWI